MTIVALAELERGLLAPEAPVLRADDEGVIRGRAVFETLRVYRGTAFKLDAHLDRLARSAALLRLPSPPAEAFAARAKEAIAAGGHPDATLRFLWTAGPDGAGPTGLVLVSTLPPQLEQLRARGLRLAIVRWAAGALAGAKSTSYAENIAAQDEAADRGCDDALLVGPDGTVLEAPTSNVWFREGQKLLTPSLALPLLAGVTRATLCELAPSVGYEVAEGSFPLERLLAADEVFLSASVREVMPVAAVDDMTLEPGSAAAALQHALREAAGYPAWG